MEQFRKNNDPPKYPSLSHPQDSFPDRLEFDDKLQDIYKELQQFTNKPSSTREIHELFLAPENKTKSKSEFRRIDDKNLCRASGISQPHRSKIKDLSKRLSGHKATSTDKFLEDLQERINKELQLMGPNIDPEDKLQIYREALNEIISVYKTYQDILKKVQDEYEKGLARRDEQISKLHGLKKLLIRITEEYEERLRNIGVELHEDNVRLYKENIHLSRTLLLSQEEVDFMQKKYVKLQKEYMQEYEKYCNLEESRNILLNELSNIELKSMPDVFMMNALPGQSTKKDKDEEMETDPFILQKALKQSREDYQKLSKKLLQYEVIYGDVVSKADHLALKQTCNELEKELIKLEAAAEKSKSDTPRPDWKKFGSGLKIVDATWQAMILNKPSCEVVNVILSVLDGTEYTGPHDKKYFDGLGDSKHVPLYLRYEGKIRNRPLTRRDIYLVIMKFWSERLIMSSEERQKQRIQTHYLSFLESRFPIRIMRAEWAYALEEGLSRFQENYLIKMFRCILNNDCDEEQLIFEINLILEFKKFLTRIENMLSSKAKGELACEVFKKSLYMFFNTKVDSDIHALYEGGLACQRDSEATVIDYSSFLDVDDEDWLDNRFSRALFSQMESESENMVSAIMEVLLVEKITPEHIWDAFFQVDKDNTDIERYIGIIFKDSTTIPRSQLEKKLVDCNMIESSTKKLLEQDIRVRIEDFQPNKF